MVATAINNCFESSAIFSIDLDNMKGWLAAEGQYRFKNSEPAKFNRYVLITKTDVTSISGHRYNRTMLGNLNFNYENKDFYIYTIEGKDDFDELMVFYVFDQYLNLKMADPLDNFQVARDSLVSRGLLKGPYTKTPEYRKILWESVREWTPDQ